MIVPNNLHICTTTLIFLLNVNEALRCQDSEKDVFREVRVLYQSYVGHYCSGPFVHDDRVPISCISFLYIRVFLCSHNSRLMTEDMGG